MRVLHISPFPPERDGIGEYCSMLCDELADQGHAVAVVSARASTTPAPAVIGSLARGRRTPSEQLLAAIGRLNPDLVHVQFAVASYGTSLPVLVGLLDALRDRGLPIVVTMHEVTRDVASLRRFGRAVYRQISRRADLVIVHTPSAQDELESFAERGIVARVIAYPRPPLPPTTVTAADLRHRFGLVGERIILAFGFIDVDKGLSDLVAAVGALAPGEDMRGVSVVVAGAVRRRFGVFRIFEARDHLHLRRVRTAARRQELQERIRFVGYVADGEVGGWLDAADLMVLPYRRCEESSVAHLGRAGGVPLLVSDAGELASLTSIPAFRAADRVALADALRRALARPASSSAARTPGADLPSWGRKIAAVYVEAIRRRAGPGTAADGVPIEFD